MQDNHHFESNSEKKDTIDLREIFDNYFRHWKWLLLGLFIALTCAFLYLKNATYQYEVYSSILINDQETGDGSYSELSVFQDLGLLGVPKTTLDTEMGVLKSRKLMEKVIKKLGLNFTYYVQDNFRTKEVYQNNVPFKVNILLKDSLVEHLKTVFTVRVDTDSKFTLLDADASTLTKGIFGERVVCEFGDLIITPKDLSAMEHGQEITVQVRPVEDIAIDYATRLKIVPENTKSKLLIISLQDQVPAKAEAVLDNLVRFYNENANTYKSQIAQSADEFIKMRIDEISTELASYDQGVETYKIDNKLSNMTSETDIILSSNAKIENQIVEFTSQLKLITYISEFMTTNTDNLIPANLGMVDEITSNNAENYNKLLLERNRLSTGANTRNPVIINLNDQIDRLRASIMQSLKNYKSSLQISINEAKRQEGRLSSKIYDAPKEEREIKDIQRQQQIYETLYLYLLQKREENSISLAGTAPIAKIIDTAYSIKQPVYPRKMIVLVVAGLLGLLIPIFIIFVFSLFDNKIHSIDDIEDIVKAPLLGDIPKSTSKKKIVVSKFEQNSVAESFRLLRTNLDHILSNTKVIKKVIFVTSTISGEGKTFVAINLAATYALLNKKVLLIGTDLRSPSLASTLGIKHNKGLSHYLDDADVQIEDIILKLENPHIDILDAGIVAPNPSELLTNERFNDVISYAKEHYDYVIVDTSPVHAVTDTLLISDYSDLTIYVIRANHLDKRLLKIPQKLYANNRLPNMAVLLNGTDPKVAASNYGYGDSKLKKRNG
jgi:capsular exopolysaccharide synthesis family protein